MYKDRLRSKNHLKLFLGLKTAFRGCDKYRWHPENSMMRFQHARFRWVKSFFWTWKDKKNMAQPYAAETSFLMK
jgi:hypothetical protein